jgi:hypothetical protein
MVFQVGISRLLLNVRTSQIFAAQRRGTVDEETYLGREIPLREVVSQQEHDATQASRVVVVQESIDTRDEAETRSGKSVGYIRTPGAFRGDFGGCTGQRSLIFILISCTQIIKETTRRRSRLVGLNYHGSDG